MPLRASAVVGSLVGASDGVWAWYRLSDASYWFTDVSRRRHQRGAVMARFADLVGHRIQFRITEHPVAARAWGADFRSEPPIAPAPPRARGRSPGTTSSSSCSSGSRSCPRSPCPPGTSASGWPASARTPSSSRPCCAARSRAGSRTPPRRCCTWTTRLGEGWAARPVTARRMAWLIASSLTPGLPVSSESLLGAEDGWDSTTIEEFTAPVRTTAEPWAPAVRIEAVRAGRRPSGPRSPRSAGRPPGSRTTPARRCSPGDSACPGRGSGVRPRRGRRARPVQAGHPGAEELEDQIDHMHEIKRKAPLRLTRLRDEAARVEDDRTDPLLDVSGPASSAPSGLWSPGASREEVVARLDELVRRAVRDQGAALSTHPGQWAAVRSFVPGEHDPTTTTGFVRGGAGGARGDLGTEHEHPGPGRGRALPRLDDAAGDHSGVLVAAGRACARPFRPLRHLRGAGRWQDVRRRVDVGARGADGAPRPRARSLGPAPKAARAACAAPDRPRDRPAARGLRHALAVAAGARAAARGIRTPGARTPTSSPTASCDGTARTSRLAQAPTRSAAASSSCCSAGCRLSSSRTARTPGSSSRAGVNSVGGAFGTAPGRRSRPSARRASAARRSHGSSGTVRAPAVAG